MQSGAPFFLRTSSMHVHTSIKPCWALQVHTCMHWSTTTEEHHRATVREQSHRLVHGGSCHAAFLRARGVGIPVVDASAQPRSAENSALDHCTFDTYSNATQTAMPRETSDDNKTT